MGQNDNDFSAFLAGFVVGGLVGAAVALIMAPQSGEETRRYIADKSIELKQTAEETAGQYREKASTYASEARTKAIELEEKAKARADEYAKAARTRVEEVATKGQETFEVTKDKVKKAVEERTASLRKGKAGDEGLEISDEV
jgi:gas vesicle protein